MEPGVLEVGAVELYEAGFVRDRTDWLRDEAGSRVAYPITSPTAFGPSYHSRSHQAVIRVYDAAGTVIETHEHAGDFVEP